MIPETLGTLTNLQRLDLSANKLTSIPETLVALTNLQYLYLSGNKYDGLNSDATLPWIKVSIAAGTVSEEAGPPSNPFPQNEEWYEKANISGDIHVPVF